MLRRLYDWVLHWAKTPYGTWALFGIAVCESSFFPIPPDVLLIALAFALPRRALFYAAVCTVGSVLGGLLGWAIGAFFYESLGQRIIQALHYESQFALVQGYYQKSAFFYIFIAAFTPIPYKVFTIAAGVFDVPLWTLLSASLFGRAGRFFLVALFIALFGPKVKPFVEKYLNFLTILLVLLAISGYFVIRWLRP